MHYRRWQPTTAGDAAVTVTALVVVKKIGVISEHLIIYGHLFPVLLGSRALQKSGQSTLLITSLF